MPRGRSVAVVAGSLLLTGLTCIGDVMAQALPPTPAGTLESQRQWLLQQVRIGEASGRQRLIEGALARLRLLAPDDRGTMLTILEVQLSQQHVEAATDTLQRLRQAGAGSRELVAAERLWASYRGDLQEELQQARLLVTGGRSAEALAIYRKLFNDDPPGFQLGLEYWRLRGSEPAGRVLAIRKLEALDRAYPGNMVLLQALAQLLFASGHNDQALVVLQRMGGNPEARTYAADTEWDYLSSQTADARNVRRLQAFIARYPSWVHLDDAKKLYEEQHKRVGNPAWLAGLRGTQLLDKSRNTEAETAFRQALRGFPNEADFLGGLGLALMRQGQREPALAYFRKAQQAQPDTSNSDKWRDLITSTSYWLLLDRADVALAAAQLDDAQALYAQAHRQQPREVNAILGLADVAQARGDDAAAEHQLQAARRIAPHDANVIRKQVQFLLRTRPAQLEAFIATLPAAQRQLYADDLRRLRIARLREQREQALVANNTAAVIALGHTLRGEQPDDPWLAYSQANILRTSGANGEADAVIADMVDKAGNTPEARYAQALYLSGSERIAQALAALEQLPPVHWNDDMRALSARLRRQQATARAWELRAAGREDDAIALLQQQPQDAQIWLLLAEWASLRGDHVQALRLYRQVLDAQPDNVEAQLGSVQALIDSGALAQARERMHTAPPQTDANDTGQQRQLASIWTSLHDNDKALAILRDLLARKTAPDPQAWRDAARLLRERDPAQALDMYTRAMEENGMLTPAQAQLRDDRALTRASRETSDDDWLRRSLRSDVETLYQQQNPTLTVLQDSGRRSDGTPGISRLSRDTRIVHLDTPIVGGLGWARLEQVRLDARSFQTDVGGFHDEDFGSCTLPLLQADGSALSVPGCNTQLRQRNNSGAGFAAGWRSLDGRWNFDFGHTPAGYSVGNWLGGISLEGDLNRLDWSATLSRRPMTNSLLSQAGAVDPRSGIAWGGVIATGLTVSLGYDEGGRNGLWSNWSWHRLSGEHVAGNTRARAMAGWYHKLIQHPDLRLDIGLTGMHWRYAHDLGGYTLGQGGYYSPQRYTSLSLPVGFAWRNDDWSVRVDASVGVSRAHTGASARFPDQKLIEQVIAQLQPLYGPLTLDQANAQTAGSNSTSNGHRLYAAAERRLGDHLVLGLAGTLQRSQDYSPNTFQLYLRYALNPWQGNLSLPVLPLAPYGEQR